MLACGVWGSVDVLACRHVHVCVRVSVCVCVWWPWCRSRGERLSVFMSVCVCVGETDRERPSYVRVGPQGIRRGGARAERPIDLPETSSTGGDELDWQSPACQPPPLPQQKHSANVTGDPDTGEQLSDRNHEDAGASYPGSWFVFNLPPSINIPTHTHTHKYYDTNT